MESLNWVLEAFVSDLVEASHAAKQIFIISDAELAS